MGAAGGKRVNETVSGHYNAKSGQGFRETHVLLTALDYKGSECELHCTVEADNIRRLAEACGVTDLQIMYDHECSRDKLLSRIRQVGSRCTPEDCFVFFFSGHAAPFEREAHFCLVDDGNQCELPETCLQDKVFAEAVCAAFPPECTLIILSDFAHTGAVVNLSRRCWLGRTAICITGCLDHDTEGDVGKAGIFSHSMLMAIDHLQDCEEQEYSVGKLYNAALKENERIFHSAQDITVQWTPSTRPDRVAWPLVPTEAYQAPLTKACSMAAADGFGADPEGSCVGASALHALFKASPGAVQECGVPSVLLQYIISQSVNHIPVEYKHAANGATPLCGLLGTC